MGGAVPAAISFLKCPEDCSHTGVEASQPILRSSFWPSMTDSLAEPHSHNLRHHRQMEGPGFFLSLSASTLASRPIDDRVASEICAALCFYAAKKLIALAAFVVMFDHWHAQLATWDGMTISKCMKLLDRLIGRQTVTDSFLLQDVLGRMASMTQESVLPNSFALFVATSKKTRFGQGS